MLDLSNFEEAKTDLHSESVTVIRRKVSGDDFDIAVTNRRTRIWAERFHEIEPEFISWCERLTPSDVLWDLGASIGHFSTFAALASGCRVYAFEPEAQNFSHCALNHFLNYRRLGERMTPLNFGVASQSYLADMYIRLYGAGEHTKSVVPSDASYRTKILLVGINEILTLGIPRPTALKIDVDGSERAVVLALNSMWPHVENLFIELPKAEFEFFVELFASYGLLLTGENPVLKMSGGIYDDIINATFAR